MVLNCFLVFVISWASAIAGAQVASRSQAQVVAQPLQPLTPSLASSGTLTSALSTGTLNFSASQIKQQAFDKAWLRLGHYKKNWQAYSSPFEARFFVDPQGKHDPEAELKSTLQKLFSKTQEGNLLQCKYPARTEYLKKTFSIPESYLHTCPEVEKWKQDLNIDSVYLIFASNDLNSISSGFGHTFLRLHNKNNLRKSDLLDYGINYAANTGTDGGAILALKGLFGQYPAVFSMLPFHQKMIEYTNLEGRDLWEYELKLSPEQINLLLNHLLEVDGIQSPYYFATDNCSQAILELLAVVYPEENIEDNFHLATFPLETVKLLNEKKLFSETKFRTSLNSEWVASFKQLDASQKSVLSDLVENQSLNFENHAEFLKLSTNEKAQVLEAILKFYAIQEYADKKDLSEIKYKLAVARSKLGKVTEPLKIEKPTDPRQSTSASALMLGHGSRNDQQFASIKYRWAYQDILSNDQGLTPFAHIEVLSSEIHYLYEKNEFEFDTLTLLKLMNLQPSTSLNRKVSWNFNLGFESQMAPILDYGIGSAIELNYFDKTRIALFLRQKNIYQNQLTSYLGPHAFLGVNLNSRIKFITSYSYFWDFMNKEIKTEYSLGLSFTANYLEFRMSGISVEDIPELHLQLVYNF